MAGAWGKEYAKRMAGEKRNMFATSQIVFDALEAGKGWGAV